YELTGKVTERNGGAHPTVVPMGGFPTADGYIVVAAFNQTFWRNLCNSPAVIPPCPSSTAPARRATSI
ncbi:MAG: CoA transferase, partial [Alphaproteobacteria bacterium]